MKYMSVKNAAEKWNVSERSVRNYCAEGRVHGAILNGSTWKIPELAEKPEVVALNKCDALDEKEIAKKTASLEKACGKKVYAISAVARKGLFECLLEVNKYIINCNYFYNNILL